MTLDDKLRGAFPGRVLNKRLTQAQLFNKVPRYVTEYLLARYAPDGNEAGVQKVKTLLTERFPGEDRAEEVKDRLLKDGRYIIVDQLKVRADLSAGDWHGEVTSFGSQRLEVDRNLSDKHPGVLAGLWGTVALAYNRSDRTLSVADFAPFQVKGGDLPAFRAGRAHFTEDEWLDVLVRSVGLNPGPMSRRLKLLYLTRLAPLVEPNVNLMEMGPRNTGKTFLLRNTSPRAYVISGGRTSVATLFYNRNTREPGLVLTQNAVVFDEVAKTSWTEDTLAALLKDYMESGTFGVGNKTFQGGGGLVFLGNTDFESDPIAKALPKALKDDTAFLERIHGLLPAWEFPKITPELQCSDYGLVVDYLAEAFKELRAYSFELPDRSWLPPGLTTRDERGVARLYSALAKLLHPDENVPLETARELVALALELRGRVFAELHRLSPSEYPERSFVPAWAAGEEEQASVA
ncbi:MAG TPA: BREX system Lon protease-like protein BrxL [Deinococcales bacterium]|nr:BREX system Lon protease-like protein BrxL [Deinococcales bacterium]